MARGYSPIFTSISGSVGNMTFVDAEDNSVIMKGKITEMTNPNTPGQQAQRGKFKKVQTLAGLLSAFLAVMFLPFTSRQNGYSAFMSASLKNPGVTDTSTLDEIASVVQYTRGNLNDPNIRDDGSSKGVDNQTLSLALHWDYDASNQAVNSTDVLHLLIVDPSNDSYKTVDTSVVRSAGSMSSEYQIFKEGVSYVAAFFKSPLDGSVSNSFALLSMDPSTGSITVL